MLRKLIESDLYDFTPDDIQMFDVKGGESLSFFEELEWDEEKRITGLY